MPILALGLNHRTAPLALREKVFFAVNEMPGPLLELVSNQSVQGVAILSTCNRTDLYCETDGPDYLFQWLQARFPFLSGEFPRYFYSHTGEAAIRHILRVACGLDSMVLGEVQILGQMKQAVGMAREAGTLGTRLARLFQYVFASTKTVRSQTGISANPVSLAFVAVSLLKHIFAEPALLSVLVIGASATTELVLRYLTHDGLTQLTVANRTLAKAEALAHRFGGRATTLHELPECLPKADVVISATSSPLPIIGKGMVERALKQRKRRPIFMVDLAVPRDIEAEVKTLEDIYLYALDDLQQVIEANWEERKQSAVEAEQLIDLQVTHFMQHLKSLDSVTTIRSYRNQVEKIQELEITKAKLALENGSDPSEVIEKLAHNLCNKIMHAPTIHLRQAGAEGKGEVIQLARQLLGIKE